MDVAPPSSAANDGQWDFYRDYRPALGAAARSSRVAMMLERESGDDAAKLSGALALMRRRLDIFDAPKEELASRFRELLANARSAVSAADEVAQTLMSAASGRSALLVERRTHARACIEAMILEIATWGGAAAAGPVGATLDLVLNLYSGSDHGALAAPDKEFLASAYVALRAALVGAARSAYIDRMLDIRVRTAGPEHERIEIYDRKRGAALTPSILYDGEGAMQSAIAVRDLLRESLAWEHISDSDLCELGDLLDATLEGGALSHALRADPASGRPIDISTVGEIRETAREFAPRVPLALAPLRRTAPVRDDGGAVGESNLAVRIAPPEYPYPFDGLTPDDLAVFLTPTLARGPLQQLGLDVDQVAAARRRRIAAESVASAYQESRERGAAGDLGKETLTAFSSQLVQELAKEFAAEQFKDFFKGAAKMALLSSGVACLGPLVDLVFGFIFPKPKPLTIEDVQKLIDEAIGYNNDIWAGIRLSDAYCDAFNAYTSHVESLELERTKPNKQKTMMQYDQWRAPYTECKNLWGRVAGTSQTGWIFECGRLPIVEDSVMLYFKVVSDMILADDLHFTYEQWLVSGKKSSETDLATQYEIHKKKTNEIIMGHISELGSILKQYETILHDAPDSTYIKTIARNDFKFVDYRWWVFEVRYNIEDKFYHKIFKKDLKVLEHAIYTGWSKNMEKIYNHHHGWLAHLQTMYYARYARFMNIRAEFNKLFSHISSIPMSLWRIKYTIGNHSSFINEYNFVIHKEDNSKMHFNLLKRPSNGYDNKMSFLTQYGFVWIYFDTCTAMFGVGDYADIYSADYGIGVTPPLSDWQWPGERIDDIRGIARRSIKLLRVTTPYTITFWSETNFEGKKFSMPSNNTTHQYDDVSPCKSMQIRVDTRFWYGLNQVGRTLEIAFKSKKNTEEPSDRFALDPDMSAIYGQ
ncbi:hypothetical protein Ms3S1_21000 [Methylosinus sp. 3S-1]